VKSNPFQIMVLLESSEPSSAKETREHQNLSERPKERTGLLKTLSLRAIGVSKKLFFVWVKIGHFAKSLVPDRRLLPHFAMILILILVVFANLDQTAQAKEINNALISVDPQTVQTVVESTDQYTPLIPDGSQIVQNESTNLIGAGGFIANAAPVETNITPRVEPLPDNTSSTVTYTVRDGDTLSGLGMSFNVKIATIKYLNNISNTDAIKPGQQLKIPPKGYEISATLIAQKANAKSAAQVAAAAKAKTAAQKTYYGTINGVRYIERSYGECYTYVESQGYAIGGHFLAKWIPTNSNTPRVGGLVVTNESWAGHVAIVIAVNGDGTFNIRERNYTPGWITERTMSVNNPWIKGFVN